MPDVTRCQTCGCPDLEWLPVSTVARRLQVSTWTVRRMLARGTLHGRKLSPRKWLIEHKSLDAWLRSADNRYDPYAEAHGRLSA